MAKVYSYSKIKYFKQLLRLYSTKSVASPKTRKIIDAIGPPDRVSNLRPINFAIPKNETELEKRYRNAREDTQAWNQNFWEKHNIKFVTERKQFQETLKTNGKESLTADDMSMFYKSFLDKNWKVHFNYNIAWYKRNIKILLLEFRVRISKLKFK